MKKVIRKSVQRRNRGPATAQRIVSALGNVDLEAKTITNSSRGTFNNCRRKFLYSYAHRLASRGIVDYFWIGGIVHGEYERMYAAGNFNKKAAHKRVSKATKEALEVCVNDSQRDKIWAASAVAQGILPVYADLYLEQDLDRFEIIECEGKFAVPIPGTDWTYRGMRDMVVRARKNVPEIKVKKGQVGLWENKTTAAMDANYFARLPLDFQILGYAWSMHADKDWEHGPADFIEYNVAQKSRLRQKKTETFGQYLDRVEGDYSADSSKYFYREKVEFNPESVLPRWLKELKSFVRELEWQIEEDTWGMNDQSCTSRGVCEFLPLCLDGPKKDVLTQYRRKAATHEELV